MRLKSIELLGFKSFAKKTDLQFASAITSIVGPNGSGKSNIAESFRFVLGEQSMKSMRGRRGEDLIWNGSPSSPRASRASVKLIFDNVDRALDLDFDEVAIERVVHRDGVNEYLLNGSQVRLRDVAELLSRANIGASGHHIISQGEADRILSASARERREMVEDALGLTSYLYKREEAEKKLEKTAENMREVEALRRELAPHLKFLQGQVKKIEDAQKLREELTGKYVEYLKRESVYLEKSEAAVKHELSAPEGEHQELDTKIETLREALGKKEHNTQTTEIMRLEEESRKVAARRDGAGRELGRVEGELAAASHQAPRHEGTIAVLRVRTFAAEIEHGLTMALSLHEGPMRERVRAIVAAAQSFARSLTHATGEGSGPSIEELTTKKESLEAELAKLSDAGIKIEQEIAALRREIEKQKDASRDAERELFTAMARRSELDAILSNLRARQGMLVREREAFNHELGEAITFIGGKVREYESYVVAEFDEPRAAQDERRKKLERIKIRLEEAGLGSATEVLKEHEETRERDDFLARELADLESSRTSIEVLIEELTQTLQTRFETGVEQINKEFSTFFATMFGGGSASIALVKEKRKASIEDEDADEEVQEGIELSVSLPHKRVKGLHMLSGGERALTSIALIFAMSQVNPPPFLILDETDAALDEANSRRYGDMIATLASRSQLILITHNRETMSRAGILYGITMGSDGVSKLLSVKFEEALAVAK